MKRITILLAVAAFTVTMMLASAVPAFAANGSGGKDVLSGGQNDQTAKDNGNVGHGEGGDGNILVGGATGGEGGREKPDGTIVGGGKGQNLK